MSLQVVQAQSVCVCVLAHRCVHSCSTLCVRNKNPKSLQVVSGHLCVCVCVCVHMCVHSCTCTLCENCVRNKNPKVTAVVSGHLCVCACVCVCVYIHALVRFVKTV